MQEPVKAEQGTPHAEVVPAGNVFQETERGFRGLGKFSPAVFVQQGADRIQGFLFLSRRLVEQVGREKLDTAVQPVQDRYPGFSRQPNSR